MDLAALTAPIPGANPAGVKLSFDTKTKLDEMRKETEESKDDPFAAPLEKKADWAGIARLAGATLAKSSKDLQVAVRFVEARTRQEGFAGLGAGLKLLNCLVADCWDRLYPLIEGPEDLELRAGPFEWLCDRESGAWFPATVRRLPLVKFGSTIASRADCDSGMIGGQVITKDNAQPATPHTAQDVADCLTELEALDDALIQKLGKDTAPSVAGLRESLGECMTYLTHLGAVPAEQAAPQPEAAANGPAAAKTVPAAAKEDGPMARAELYRLLAQLADNLSAMEPHSPIPDLLRWAVKLGNMPFRDLIKEMVREPNALAGIRRQFGIKNAEETEN